MLVTVEGTYRDGRVELEEKPPAEAGARVIVTFLEPADEANANGRERLRQRALRRMAEGVHLGGPPYPAREELHERSGG